MYRFTLTECPQIKLTFFLSLHKKCKELLHSNLNKNWLRLSICVN